MEELADFLKTGADKCFNEPEGMRAEVASTSQLSDEDVTAIATYIHALHAKPGNPKHKTC